MKRRDVLIGGGVGVAAALAGCLDVVTGNEQDEGGENHGGAPVVADGVAYYGREDGLVYAVDLEDGSERWRFDTGAEINLSIAGADGVVYAGNTDGDLLAVDMAAGEEVWRVEPEGWFPGGELFTPEVVDGVVYYGTKRDGLAAVDADTGDEMWAFDPASRILIWKRAISFNSAIIDGVVYVGVGDVLYGLDTATGEQRRRFETAGTTSSPTTGDGIVCVGGDSEVHALDLDSWTERWRVDTGDKVWFPTVRDGTVYVPNDGGVMTALAVESGETLWEFETGGELHTPPAFTDDAVLFGSHEGFLYAVDRETGEERWTFSVGEGADFAGVAAAPTVVDDRAYLAAPGLTIVGIEVASGEERVRHTHG